MEEEAYHNPRLSGESRTTTTSSFNGFSGSSGSSSSSGIVRDSDSIGSTIEGTTEESCTSSSPRDLSIKALNYGYVVTVGCHKFAIETKERLIEKLSQYYTDPEKTEAEWFKTKAL